MKEVFGAEGDTVEVGQPLLKLELGEGDQEPASSKPNSSADVADTPAKVEEVRKPTPVPPSRSPSSDINKMHGHVPLIKFRHGQRDANDSSPSLIEGPAPVGGSESYLDLPPLYGRPQMSEEEMNLIELGGAEP